MELTGLITDSFELLQIEAVALLLVLGEMLIQTVFSFHSRKNRMPENSVAWLLGGAVVFLALAGFFVVGIGAENFVFAGLLALGFFLALLRPINALCFFLCLMFLRPWEIMPPNTLMLALPRITGILAIGTFLVEGFKRKDLWFSATEKTFLALALWAFLSTFAAADLAEAQKVYLDGFLRAVVIYFLIVWTVEHEGHLGMLKRTLLYSIAGLASVSVVHSFTFLAENPGERLKAVGSLENSNDIAAILIIGIPLALAGRKSWLHISFFRLAIDGVYSLVSFWALWLAQSRGAVLALLTSISTAVFVRTRHKMAFLLVLGITVGVAFPAINSFLRRDLEDLSQSHVSRIAYWKAGARMALHNPIFGVGFGHYPEKFHEFASGELFEFGKRTAHSSWVLALAETGVPGFLLLLIFVVLTLKYAWKIRQTDSALLYSLTGYLVAISFLSHTWLIYPWMLFGTIVAAYKVRSQE